MTAGSATAANDVAIGGIFGYSSGYQKADGCTNSGAIVFAESSTANANFRVGGIGGYVAYASGNHIVNCLNSGDITISGDIPNDKYTSVGGIFGATQESIVDGCKNTATILLADTASTQKVFVGGIGGKTKDGDAVQITNCYNSGKVQSKSKGTDNNYVGGILGYFWSNKSKDLIDDIENVDAEGVVSKVAVTSTLENVINTGDVLVENASAAVAVGGIVGKTAIKVTNAQAYCDVQAPGTNVGWIMGTARADATCADGGAIGATPQKVWNDRRQEWVEGDPVFDGTTYMEYIYGGETVWAEGSNYDGVGYLQAAPALPTVPAKPATPDSSDSNEEK